jgi:hypothetical protein
LLLMNCPLVLCIRDINYLLMLYLLETKNIIHVLIVVVLENYLCHALHTCFT